MGKRGAVLYGAVANSANHGAAYIGMGATPVIAYERVVEMLDCASDDPVPAKLMTFYRLAEIRVSIDERISIEEMP